MSVQSTQVWFTEDTFGAYIQPAYGEYWKEVWKVSGISVVALICMVAFLFQLPPWLTTIRKILWMIRARAGMLLNFHHGTLFESLSFLSRYCSSLCLAYHFKVHRRSVCIGKNSIYRVSICCCWQLLRILDWNVSPEIRSASGNQEGEIEKIICFYWFWSHSLWCLALNSWLCTQAGITTGQAQANQMGCQGSPPPFFFVLLLRVYF